MRATPTVVLATIVLIITGCAGRDQAELPPLAVVPQVDIERYMGTWHEIARYPNSFQDEECTGTTATYTLRQDGSVSVLNRCTSGGEEETASGKAWVVDPQAPAKLKVQFFWPFSGDYWVIQLDDDYRYAVVGHPKRKYLWILCREPGMDEATYRAILAQLQQQGYDPDRLIPSGQQL